MAKKNDPFAALMVISQDQQGYFTTKQAIRRATRTIPIPIMCALEIGNGFGAASTGWRISQRRRMAR